MPALSSIELRGWRDPAALFVAVEAQQSHAFWLDAGSDARDGWSFLGAGVPVTSQQVRAVDLGAAPARDGSPFRGGYIGVEGYEAAARRAGAPTAAGREGVGQDAESQSAMWLRVDAFLAFDHAARAVHAHAQPEVLDRFARDSQLRLDAGERVAHVDAPTPHHAVARHTPEAYAELIERCRAAIHEGDAYQLCLTNRFTVAGRFEPADVYQRLRSGQSSHHSAYLRSGDTALVTITPERFLRVEDGRVATSPIKGTRRRDVDPVIDSQLAAELLASPKERAENVMIVDLMRNDLARVGVPGTVRVDALLSVESYASVHQLVSTVSAQLPQGTTWGALLDATLPAGSMTGAPKLSAMTILHTLEDGPRGFFAGCVGWVGYDGDADVAMVIRSVVMLPDEAYVGAGGGITWGSVAAAEVEEVGIKARAPLAALGAVLPPGW